MGFHVLSIYHRQLYRRIRHHVLETFTPYDAPMFRLCRSLRSVYAADEWLLVSSARQATRLQFGPPSYHSLTPSPISFCCHALLDPLYLQGKNVSSRPSPQLSLTPSVYFNSSGGSLVPGAFARGSFKGSFQASRWLGSAGLPPGPAPSYPRLTFGSPNSSASRALTLRLEGGGIASYMRRAYV